MYSQEVYDAISPSKIALNASTPAECAALVRRDHPSATAAEHSNTGGDWCFAVLEA